MSTETTATEKFEAGKLIDLTKCVGCRGCQVACKQWNEMPAEKTAYDGKVNATLQQPAKLSAKSLTVITYHELENPGAPGGLDYVFAKRGCMHCDEPACASACPVTALHKTAEGPVTYDKEKCIGCRYCMWACPWGVPTAEWDSLAPKIDKCTLCYDRETAGSVPAERNGKPLTEEEQKRYAGAYAVPACAKTCIAGAIKFGDRDTLLAEAKERMARSPGKYVDHVYGEKEAGGTNVMYLSPVPFDRIGFPKVGDQPYPRYSKVALGAVPGAVIGVGAVLGGAYALQKRKAAVELAEAREFMKAPATRHVPEKKAEEKHEHHPRFEPLKKELWTPFNKVLAALMAFGGVSFIARFALGLGKSTNLSDTWAWGLWIVFDLVWIAVAAGAFATAGLIYVFQRKDLYSIGRGAVLMGLLSYSFVTVTLLADLGLPWHFYQLGLQAPEHSAMFEVSWCVGLYVTVLLFEFLPVPFERWGMKRAAEAWKKWSPWYVVIALSLFVYLLSRKPMYSVVAAVVFGFLAYAFRTRDGQKPEPIMLAIAAVTLSTMHQSSLGSLFLLMPDKLALQWWSPVMPVSFFLSSIAAGLSLVILVEMWIAKAWNRPMRVPQLAALGQAAFWSLLVYTAFRLGDLALRGQLGAAFAAPGAGLFAAEVALGGLAPLALLASPKLRSSPGALALGAALACGGVVFNRVNVVVLAMSLKGPMPQQIAQSYHPSVFEWGISVGLIAATIFLFGLGVRLMPVLPAAEEKASA
ncbi:MAG TPA: 4Fe-4S dicluster domain-containing protein [Anaeromyxobacteraceae bacterium]|nr:4Fe-4S dicluster domain-containing protein [Anaeromyxobacteraceae bacterium]